MRVPSISQRQVDAAGEGLRKAETFFLGNPDRRYWVRPSIPFEMHGWGAESHILAPLMVVALTGPREMQKHALRCDPTTIPDDEKFLGLLVSHLATTGSQSLSPEIHASLLGAAGHEVIR